MKAAENEKKKEKKKTGLAQSSESKGSTCLNTKKKSNNHKAEIGASPTFRERTAEIEKKKKNRADSSVH